MAFDYRFTCPLPAGMHARPASALEHVARRFAADIAVCNERTSLAANAKSVLGIVSLDIRHGDSCLVTATGRDAAWAIESLRVFIERALPRVDDVAAPPPPRVGELRLPRALAQAGATVTPGCPVVPGIGIGNAVAIGKLTVPATITQAGVTDTDAETQRVERGIGRLLARYDERLGRQGEGVEADVLRAHRSVARDPEFGQAVVRGIRERGLTAAGAVAAADAQFGAMLAATGSALLLERALDIRDVCRALLREVYGEALAHDEAVLTADSVCVADTMTPGQLLALDRRLVKGLVLVHGGTTSHTVILARSAGIPTLVGVAGIDASAIAGSPVVVDADLGAVVTGLTPAAERYYDMERRRLDRRRARVHLSIERPAVTEDGRRVEIGANIGAAADVAPAVAVGAEGVGLFRTEHLFLARKDPPSEDEQCAQYARAVTDAGGRPVIVRTLDVGGDKPLPYLPLPREDNPFLGYRAVRIYREFEGLFRTQIRALVRASASGPLRVMIPMVSRLDEVAWVREVIADEQARLAAAGVAFDPAMRVGAMIEVPSAAFLIGPLAASLDFFSVGTNDLLQYFLAMDRTSPRLAPLADPLEPAFLRLLDQVVADAHAAGRWIGLCGEMGGQARCLPILVGLGFDELSVSPPDIAATKSRIGELSAAACRALVERAVQAASARDVARLVEGSAHGRPHPLTGPDLVALDADCTTKAEAIKAAVDLLYGAGRTDQPRDVEDAVWRREAEYSTGFGYGFAIPHCKTAAVGTSSMAVVRLRAGVDWGALDGQPVRTVVLLAVRESEPADAHMRVLASLARRLMHEEFRGQVETENDPASLCRLLIDG